MRFKICIMALVVALLLLGCDGVGLFNLTGLPSGNYNGSISITQTGPTLNATQRSTLRITIDDQGFPVELAGPLQRLVANTAIVDLDERTVRERTVRTVTMSGDTTTIHSRLEITITTEPPLPGFSTGVGFSTSAGFSTGQRQIVITGSAMESYLNAAPNVVFSSQATLTVTDRSTNPLTRTEPQTASRRESGILVRQTPLR